MSNRPKTRAVGATEDRVGDAKRSKARTVVVPITTKRDIEQTTYTAVRSKQLRQGNIGALSA